MRRSNNAVVKRCGRWPTTTSSGPVILPTIARSTPAAPTRPVLPVSRIPRPRPAQPAACDGCGDAIAASCQRRTIASSYCSHRCPVCPETSAVRAGSVVRAQGPGSRQDGRDPSHSRQRSRTIQEKRQEGRLQLSRRQSQRDHRSSSRCVSHRAFAGARAKDRACACTLTSAPGAPIVSAAGVCDSMHLSLFLVVRVSLLPPSHLLVHNNHRATDTWLHVCMWPEPASPHCRPRRPSNVHRVRQVQHSIQSLTTARPHQRWSPPLLRPPPCRRPFHRPLGTRL